MIKERVACWLEERCQVAKDRYSHFTTLAKDHTHTTGRFLLYFLLAGFYLLLAEFYYRTHEWVRVS